MRLLLLFAMALAPQVHAQPSADSTLVYESAIDRFEITLPQGFVHTEREIAEGVRVHLFREVETDGPRTVILVTYQGFTPHWQDSFPTKRVLQASLPQFGFEEVDVDDVLFSESRSEGVARAYVSDEPIGGDVGVVVRGCDGTRCYSLSASGPNTGDPSDWQRHATLLRTFSFEE